MKTFSTLTLMSVSVCMTAAYHQKYLSKNLTEVKSFLDFVHVL